MMSTSTQQMIEMYTSQLDGGPAHRSERLPRRKSARRFARAPRNVTLVIRGRGSRRSTFNAMHQGEIGA